MICLWKSRLLSRDRKSTRLNSSHVKNSYAVFCLKKKKSEPVDHVHNENSYQQEEPMVDYDRVHDMVTDAFIAHDDEVEKPNIDAKKFYEMLEAANSYRKRHFFFSDATTADIYTLSLHDALPI